MSSYCRALLVAGLACCCPRAPVHRAQRVAPGWDSQPRGRRHVLRRRHVHHVPVSRRVARRPVAARDCDGESDVRALSDPGSPRESDADRACPRRWLDRHELRVDAGRAGGLGDLSCAQGQGCLRRRYARARPGRIQRHFPSIRRRQNPASRRCRATCSWSPPNWRGRSSGLVPFTAPHFPTRSFRRTLFRRLPPRACRLAKRPWKVARHEAPAHHPHRPRVPLFANMLGRSTVAVCFQTPIPA
jgi:hypothetical protein